MGDHRLVCLTHNMRTPQHRSEIASATTSEIAENSQQHTKLGTIAIFLRSQRVQFNHKHIIANFSSIAILFNNIRIPIHETTRTLRRTNLMCRSILRRWSSRASKATSSYWYGNCNDNGEVLDLDASTGSETSSLTSSDRQDDNVMNKKVTTSCSSCNDENSQLRTQRRFTLPLTIKFLAVYIFLSTAIAFGVGCIARIVLLHNLGLLPEQQQLHQATATLSKLEAAPPPPTTGRHHELPTPTIIPGKSVPYTTYTSMSFRVEGSALTAHTRHIDRRGGTNSVSSSTAQEEDVASLQRENITSYELAHLFDDDEDSSDDDHEDDDGTFQEEEEELHLPSGQHLLVDMKDVDSTFLNSEERLASAMVRLIEESKLTLLSYHCHSLVPVGVSCAGVLLESHVSFALFCSFA